MVCCFIFSPFKVTYVYLYLYLNYLKESSERKRRISQMWNDSKVFYGHRLVTLTFYQITRYVNIAAELLFW